METGTFFGRAGAGASPALIVVDMSRGFTEPASPLGCDVDGAVAAIGRLLEVARGAGVPVVYTTIAYEQRSKRTARTFIAKAPGLLALEAGSGWVEIDPRIAPRDDEPVLSKLFASAFFGTPLATLLTAHRVDTLVVTGASTSGCVRATVVDAMQYGYVPVVVREAVGDRDVAAHEGSLRDMAAKYGDVVGLDEALAYLREPSVARVSG